MWSQCRKGNSLLAVLLRGCVPAWERQRTQNDYTHTNDSHQISTTNADKFCLIVINPTLFNWHKNQTTKLSVQWSDTGDILARI